MSETTSTNTLTVTPAAGDYAAAASAVCAAKSASWEALRQLNAGACSRLEVAALMREATAVAEQFRARYHPDEQKAFGIGDRGIDQRFEVYVVDHSGDGRRVWAEAVTR
ncbi:hypothetical protein [Nocardioides campestrisoli]|uniref:hypothetical protein n=1 Tax=Nocardioides campestrisoli TaxID=2736757 RepID=UPI0015E7DFDD|nr:hypothetical protein [Nocardioides campestrisoli]